MATDLVGNVRLQRFIQLLADLNHQSADALKTGKIGFLEEMNKTVEEMYSIQRVGTEDAYTAIDDEMQMILQNFNAIVAMIKSNETERLDGATSVAVKKFLRNIFDATVNIVTKYGLV